MMDIEYNAQAVIEHLTAQKYRVTVERDRLIDDLIAAKAELESLRQYKAEAESQEPVVEIKWHGKSGDYYMEELKSRGIHKGMKLYARPFPAGSCAVPEGYTAVKTETVQWLLGENGDFVCPKNQYFRNKPTLYFWRKALRESMLSTIPSNSEGEKS